MENIFRKGVKIGMRVPVKKVEICRGGKKGWGCNIFKEGGIYSRV